MAWSTFKGNRMRLPGASGAVARGIFTITHRVRPDQLHEALDTATRRAGRALTVAIHI